MHDVNATELSVCIYGLSRRTHRDAPPVSMMHSTSQWPRGPPRFSSSSKAPSIFNNSVQRHTENNLAQDGNTGPESSIGASTNTSGHSHNNSLASSAVATRLPTTGTEYNSLEKNWATDIATFWTPPMDFMAQVINCARLLLPIDLCYRHLNLLSLDAPWLHPNDCQSTQTYHDKGHSKSPHKGVVVNRLLPNICANTIVDVPIADPTARRDVHRPPSIWSSSQPPPMRWEGVRTSRSCNSPSPVQRRRR